MKALNYLIHSFEWNILIMDYRVRRFTRDISGHKHYIDHEINSIQNIDHEINSIQNFIAEDTKEQFQMINVNVYQENIFHTKMMLKETEL